VLEVGCLGPQAEVHAQVQQSGDHLVVAVQWTLPHGADLLLRKVRNALVISPHTVWGKDGRMETPDSLAEAEALLLRRPRVDTWVTATCIAMQI
jgi:hypothetical protein